MFKRVLHSVMHSCNQGLFSTGEPEAREQYRADLSGSHGQVSALENHPTLQPLVPGFGPCMRGAREPRPPRFMALATLTGVSGALMRITGLTLKGPVTRLGRPGVLDCYSVTAREYPSFAGVGVLCDTLYSREPVLLRTVLGAPHAWC